jgi:UDP-2,3-diacylglucosamine hydrolase
MIYFISDIHLNPEYPERAERFREFVEAVEESPGARESAQVYILGDLFDFWYEQNRKIFIYFERELALLRRLAGAARDVGIIFGNRDFAYECHLPRRIGGNIRILGDEAEISPAGRRILLLHGDLLCRNDKAYLRARRRIRSRPVRFLFRLLPWNLARRAIGKMMRSSARHRERTEPRRLEFDEGAVREMLKRGFDGMIFGHIHRQFSDRIEVDGRDCEIASPGSCLQRLEYAVMDESGLHFHP